MENFPKNISAPKNLRLILALCLAAVSVYAIRQQYLIENVNAYTGSILTLIFVGASFLNCTVFEKCDKRAMKFGYVLGFLYALSCVLGKSLYETDTLIYFYGSLSGFINSNLCVVGLSVVWGGIFALFFKWNGSHKTKFEDCSKGIFSYSRKNFYIKWILIFCLWLPCYLSFFPTTLSYDIYYSIRQAYMGVLILNNPVMYTVFVKFCCFLESICGIAYSAMVFYSVFQMLILSAAFAYTLNYAAKIRLNKIYIMLMFFFYALLPVNALMSIATTKEPISTALLCVITCLIVDIIREPEVFFANKRRMIVFGVLLLLLAFSRLNYIALIIVFMPLFVIALKKYLKKAIIISLSVLCLFFFINGPVFTRIGLVRKISENDVSTAYCVGLQQIANVCGRHYYEFTEEEIRDITDAIIDPMALAQNYNPRFADPVTNYLVFYADGYDRKAAVKIYFDLLKRYPLDYLDSFMCLNLQSWYPDATIYDPASRAAYISIGGSNEYYQVPQNSLLPQLKPFYLLWASGESIAKIPVFGRLFSLAVPFWVSMLTLFLLIYKRKTRYALVSVFPLTIWLTHMFGAVTCFRYLYPCFALMPLLVFLSLSETESGL